MAKRLAYEIHENAIFYLCLVVLLAWLGEGVAIQSGWLACPQP